MYKKNNILIIASHPDDELLGCGGTIAKHIEIGDKVSVLILSTGVTSRYKSGSKNASIEKDKYDLYLASKMVSNCLGYDLYCENIIDQQFDNIPLIEITKKIEKCIDYVKPNIVYTHNDVDLNMDHRLTFEATITACRPCNNNKVSKILLFETVSSSEWSYKIFNPNFFNILTEEQFKLKNKALKFYKSEMKDYPHPRSFENIKNKALCYGSIVLSKYAEAFKIFRIIN